MKGMIGLILVAVIVSLVSLGVITYSLSSSVTSIATTAKEVEILKAIDRVEAVKRGLPYLFNYSFSQAVYQLSKNGGFTSSWQSLGVPGEPDGPYWRVYEKTYVPPNHNFFQIAEALSKGFSKKYFNELKEETSVTLAKEPELNLKPSNTRVCSLIIKKGILEYKGSFFTIEDKANLSLIVDCSMLKLLKKAKEEFVDSDGLKSSIETAIDKIPKECKSAAAGDLCEQDVDPEGWLSRNCPDADEKLEHMIDKEVRKTIDFDYGSIEVKPLKIVTKHTSSYTYESSESNYPECGCKKWGEAIETDYQGESDEDCDRYCEGIGYDRGYLAKDGNCTCQDCEIAYKKLKDVVYHYGYKGAISARINITSYGKHLVYDNRVEAKQPVSTIYVNTSSDYSYKPL